MSKPIGKRKDGTVVQNDLDAAQPLQVDEERWALFSKLEELNVPDRFRNLLGRKISLQYLEELKRDEKYPHIASAIVLWRNRLTQFEADCSEESALSMFDDLDPRTLERYARFYKKSEGCLFDKHMGALFFELEAIKGDSSSAFRVGRYYRDGKYLPQDVAKAEMYFLKSAEMEIVDARIALSRLYCSQGRVDEAISVAVGPAGAVSPIQLHTRALAYLKKHDTGKAIEDFEEAISQGYNCSVSEILKISLDEDSDWFDLERSVEIVDKVMAKNPAAGAELVKFYSKRIKTHPEYRGEIIDILDRMTENGYESAPIMKAKLVRKKVL